MDLDEAYRLFVPDTYIPNSYDRGSIIEFL